MDITTSKSSALSISVLFFEIQEANAALFLKANFLSDAFTAWNVSKYGVISGLYSSVFGLNTGKYEPEITPYLDTFHAVIIIWICSSNNSFNKNICITKIT